MAVSRVELPSIRRAPVVDPGFSYMSEQAVDLYQLGLVPIPRRIAADDDGVLS
jgi:hypothetical protein